MLFLTYSTLNWKTYDKSDIDIGKLNLDDELDEEIPIIEQVIPPPPPPPPPAAPEVIEVVEDEEEVEETVIESTETDQEEEIEVEEIEIEEVVEDVEVPFAVIENVPEYPGCERGSNAEKRKCMSDKIAKFVQRKFNTDLAGDLGLSGRQRISVIFKIDKNGNVVGVRSRAPHPRLEKEAARVINMLPKMKPGRQRGKPVIVPYSLPITFQVQD
jgi:protein TonB